MTPALVEVDRSTVLYAGTMQTTMSPQLHKGKSFITFIKVFISLFFSYAIRNEITTCTAKNTKDRYHFRNNSECSFVSNWFIPIDAALVAIFLQINSCSLCLVLG